jgi:Tfp pilus assembly protein PilF
MIFIQFATNAIVASGAPVSRVSLFYLDRTMIFFCNLIKSLLAAAPLFTSLLALNGHAVPFVPPSDLTPLERLATKPGKPGEVSAADRSARAMRAALKLDPKNADLAARIAQIYVSQARSGSDPRYMGQAQSALAAWWAQEAPPMPILLLRATIRQSTHDFANARLDLDQAVKREPGNAQAWLTMATVQQVTGDLQGATESCRRVVPITPALIGVTCMASIDSAQGRAAEAFDALNAALLTSAGRGRDSVGVRTWALTLQAEIAERLNRATDAERLYKESLLLDPTDAYAMAAYADFLLDAGRPNDVLALISATTRADVLLLRYALAAKLAGSNDATQVAKDLGERFAASKARGDRVHLREEARYALAIKGDPQAALTLARENWQVQKEPLDARIALETARQPKAVADVVTWIESTRLQGEKLAQLVAKTKNQMSAQ